MARPILVAFLAAVLLAAGAGAVASRPVPWTAQVQAPPPPPAVPLPRHHLHPAAIAAIVIAAAAVAIGLFVGLLLCCRRLARQAVAAADDQPAGRSQVVVHMTATRVQA
jgi:hypothetical protein